MSFNNNTTFSVQPKLSSLDYLHFAVLLLMCAACLFGNLLVICAIKVTRKTRIVSFILIINLSICDLLTAVSGIPFTLIVYNLFYRSRYYPYGEFGCKTLWSFTTYAKTCSIFTLATIAVERYVNTASINIKLTQKISYAVITVNHLVAFLVVIPYSIHLHYEVTPSGVFCYEVWSVSWHNKAYTIALFIIQYALPLCIMIIFYLFTWRKIYMRNKSVIQMSEDYENKMEWQQESHKASITETIYSTLSRKTSKEIVKSNSSFTETTSSTIEKKSTFSIIRSQSWDLTNRGYKKEGKFPRRGSEGTCLKKNQTDNSNIGIVPYKRTLLSNRFQSDSQNSLQTPSLRKTAMRKNQLLSIPTSISISESLCSADSIRDRKRFNKSGYRSQIAYMRHRQSVKTLRMFTMVVVVFACFSLPNQVYQWLIMDYPFLSSTVAHIFILLSYVSSIFNCWIYGCYHSSIRRAYMRLILCSCNKRKRFKRKQESFLSEPPKSPSLYPQRQEQMFKERRTSFDIMFQEHNRNFDRIKHLYRVSNVEEESENADELTSFIDET